MTSDEVKKALVAEIVRAFDDWLYDENGDEVGEIEADGHKWRVRTPFGGDDNLIEVECDGLPGEGGLRMFAIEVREI